MKPENLKKERVSVEIPKIEDEPTPCLKEAVKACKFGALINSGEKIMFLPNLCHSCAACWTVCPDEIDTIEREFGTVSYGDTKWGTEFVDGNLDVGEVITPEMIRRTKEKIASDKVTVIDGPPGAGCPLDATIDGSDYIILVTEPTVFGLHDLKRAVKLVKLENIPCGVVINRSDIGKVDIKSYCNEENIPILMEIPFNKKIAENYSKGEILIEIIPEMKKLFANMYTQILEELK